MDDEDRVECRTQVSQKVIMYDLPKTQCNRYKTSYQQLKDLKIEIEHLQHLLEHARHRLTRDFEHWYINVYLETSQDEIQTRNLLTPTISNVTVNEEPRTFSSFGARAALAVIKDQDIKVCIHFRIS